MKLKKNKRKISVGICLLKKNINDNIIKNI